MEQPQQPAPLPTRFQSESEKSWHEFRRKESQEAPKRLEEAAKYLSGMISISFAIFSASGSRTFTDAEPVALTVMCIFWLLSLLLTFAVIFPVRWHFVQDSAQSIEQAHRAATRYKYRYLVAGTAFFMLALGVAAWLLVEN